MAGKFIIAAEMLQIEHGDNPSYWNVSPNPSTSRAEAKLIQVWFLHIEGKANEDWLKPATQYGAYFVYKLLPGAKGFKSNKIELIAGNSVKTCYLDESAAASLHSQGIVQESDVPKRRDADQWLEIEMGRFENQGRPDAQITFLVKNHNTNVEKTGLCVQGIELRALGQN